MSKVMPFAETQTVELETAILSELSQDKHYIFFHV